MKTTPKKTRQKGFALIVTLSLMILLTVIAVGLLTLSTITLRSTSQGAAQAVANSNARMALMLAIGDLQKHLGPDQRITADAGSFKANSQQPNVVGVWDSYGWIPDKGTGEGELPKTSEKAGKFRTWLVSTKEKTSATDFAYVDSAPPSDSIWLSNPETTQELPPNNTTMKAERIPLTVGATKGGMAWQVSDNSTKAQINIASRNSSTEIGKNIANRTAATAPSPGVLDESLAVDDPERLISLPTAALAVGRGNKEQMKEVTARSSALTTSSLGLLTDVNRGGLKTDLTPLMENDTLNLGDFFGSPTPTPYYSMNDGAPRWDYLRDHYRKYKNGRLNAATIGTGTPRIRTLSADFPTTIAPPRFDPKPGKELLLPVITKLQIMMSIVAHRMTYGARDAAYKEHGQPKPTEFVAPHLVYDPVITLYNPYDVTLELNQLRLKISDPPIGFQFKKHDNMAGTESWLRPEFAPGGTAGAYHGLGSFQIANQYDPTAKKEFVFFLRKKTATGYGSFELLPGEVKVFSPFVETEWDWTLETKSGGLRAFFDWANDRNFGTKDGRTGNAKGIETVPGFDTRAGLQTDHLSYSDFDKRPANSRYSFEIDPATGKNRRDMGEGWVALRMSDSITVNCKPLRIAKPGLPDFQVDLMAGGNDLVKDALRSYQFRMADVTTELSLKGTNGIIERTRTMEEILQDMNDKGPAGKDPFAVFTMSAKTTVDGTSDSKAWAFNNIVTEGGSQDSGLIGNAAQSYELSVRSVNSFTTFPGIEMDRGPEGDEINRGYYGASTSAAKGISLVPMYRIPVAPAASMGDWIAANLISSSQFPRVSYPLGNSFAHPLIPVDRVEVTPPPGISNRFLDHSWLLNSVMWDSYYFSSAAEYRAPALDTARDKKKVLEEFFTGKERMLNSRLVAYISGSSDATKTADDYATLGDFEFAKGFAKNAMIEGAFNINSSSIDAWRAVLSSLRKADVVIYKKEAVSVGNKTAFVRNGIPLLGSSDDPNPANSVNADGQLRWAGFRSLTDDQIGELAKCIVEEIRERNKKDGAPSLTLGDFINRRLGSDSDVHALRGILQTAIDKADVNKDYRDDSRDINGSGLSSDRTLNLKNPKALDGKTADGAAPMLSQGDLLTALAPVITVRGDTFTIRTYGDARAANGTTILAKAWCEATVQRLPEYVDPINPPEFDVSGGLGDIEKTGLTDANKTFGRRFVVTSFRWLNSTEI